MSKFINSVTEPLCVNDIGTTLMHEHIVSANWNMRHCYPDWFERSKFIEYAVQDVKLAKQCGIRTLVDVTPVCLGRDISIVKDVAQKSGMQIIAATGFFHTEEQWMFNRSVDSFLHCMMTDIEQGMDGTDIKPALIKCCTDQYGLTKINQKLLDASAIAAQKSGLPISTHASWENKAGLDQLKLFARHNINMKKVVIGHCGDINDISYLENLLSYGCYIGLDRFGDNEKNPLENRVDMLIHLCDKGYIDQLMVSHDHVCFVDIGPHEWRFEKETAPSEKSYTFTYFHKYAIPSLLRRGFTKKNIDQLLIQNPQSYFSQD